MSTGRSILFVVNPNRDDARLAGEELAKRLGDLGFACYGNSDVELKGLSDASPEEIGQAEIAIVLGGDGTMLRAAESEIGRAHV